MPAPAPPQPQPCRYQPYHDVLVSTAWGAPKEFFKGFNPANVPTE